MLYIVIILGVDIIEGRGRILASLGWEIIVERVCRGSSITNYAIIHEGGKCTLLEGETNYDITSSSNSGIANPLIKKYSSCALC